MSVACLAVSALIMVLAEGDQGDLHLPSQSCAGATRPAVCVEVGSVQSHLANGTRQAARYAQAVLRATTSLLQDLVPIAQGRAP